MNVYNKFTRQALLNLTIVAAAGVLLRYKILFSLPFFDYKNLLHAHSHFAFSGWISLALFISITAAIANYASISISVYTRLFILAQVAAFGMLLTFPFMGYKAPSIAFSTLSIFFSYGFTWFAWKDMNRSKLSKIVIAYFKAALFFYALSSLGAFNLAWLMASKNGDQHWYIGSIYFFLHFQYNGWFLFAILGLFFYQLERLGVVFNKNRARTIFWLLAVSCVPAFLLSALWMQLPQWLYLIAVAAALIQVFAIALLLKFIAPLYKVLRRQLLPATRVLWLFALIALTAKFVLQALSTIPSLSHFAFGYRPVVIGYLHLIFLGFATFFIIGYKLQQQLFPAVRVSRTGLVLFVSGALLNELFLLITGIAAIEYTGVPVINYFLLAAAVIMFTGAALMTGKLWQNQPAAFTHLYDQKIKMVH